MKSWQVDSLALLLLLAAASSASAQSASGGEAPKWDPYVDAEAKLGTKRSIGAADLFLPISQSERSLVFGDMRGRFDDGNGYEGNFGLGYRRMLESGWNLGGYGYYDRQRSDNNNFFNQITLGAEALGRDWDFRANAYLPQGNKVRDLGTSSTATVSANTVLVSSVTTEERALKGFDTELGWRVPLFAIDDPRQLRVYAGGYYFKDDVTKLSGPRVRAELTMAELPQLWPGAQLVASAEMQDDNIRGGQSFISVRLRIPLGADKTRARTLNWQERRMAAAVVRDVDIVAPAVARAPVVETATTLANGQAFTVVSSDMAPTGTDLQNALVAAGANSAVVLSGTFNTGATTLGLQSGQTLAGSVAVRTPSGHTAMTPAATINSSRSTPNTSSVAMGANSTLTGMTINDTTSGLFTNNIYTVAADSVSGARIVNNTIASSHGTGALLSGIFIHDAPGAVVSGNSVTARQISGTVTALEIQGNSTVAVTGNTLVAIEGTGGANALEFTHGSITATVSGNTLSASGSITVRSVGVAAATVTINAGSTGNVRNAACNFSGSIPSSGSIGFTDGTTCP